MEDTDKDFLSHFKEIGEETLPPHLVEISESWSENLSLRQKEQFKKFLVNKKNVFLNRLRLIVRHLELIKLN